MKTYIGQLKKRKTPLVLTVHGPSQLGVQNATSYQTLLDRLERAETLAGLRTGLEQIRHGEGIPVDQVESFLRKKHGFSR